MTGVHSTARSVQGKVIMVTGASRGIGAAMAMRLAADGARLALVAKTSAPNPKIAGSLPETAEAVIAAGGEALQVPCDLQDEAAVRAAVDMIAAEFGGIDVIVNNAAALDLRRTPTLPIKSFDRLHNINVRGPFILVQAAYEYLAAAENAHILTVSPPLNLAPQWAAAHLGHTVNKYAASLCTLGWAAEFASVGIAANSLWPATTIASTGMVAAMGQDAVVAQARTPQIMADAAHAVISRSAAECTGNFFTDEQVLRAEGVEDLSGYRLAATEADLGPDFYLPDTPLPRI